MDPQKAKSIFLHAVEHIAPDEWPNYLSVACSDNPALRNEVEVLLAAHQDDGDLADQARQACAEALPTLDQPITEKPGTQIGPYKLLQQLGEGGMGVVYMAEQKEPVKRRVALKIIKPGMDTRQVIARFEAERQALAMMDHPNIAKVLDAGATESGRPYFVMELVNGLSVTKYCDEQHLTARERLDLFIPICQAVQHAHQKGIIHRDLKPSNILVALYDGKPVPKVIDFGVAKATSQTLTEMTMFTQLGQVVGTLEYMSPEQAERNQLDIDTRSDIYSLGVVLYELLTGDTPFDRTRLRSAAFEEMLRIIREEEPPRPSTRLSSSQALPTIAANRHIEPQRLSVLVRGELDWIVMKALEKDRARRYETASSLAADVTHYLNGDAVTACPPSAGYRFRKFARRNKAALTTTGVVAASLVLGLLATSWQAIRATQAEQRTEQSLLAEQKARADTERERGKAVANLETAEQQRQRATKNLELAMQALDQVYLEAVAEKRLFDQNSDQHDLLARRNLTQREQEFLRLGVGFYEQFVQQNNPEEGVMFQVAQAMTRLGHIQTYLGSREKARDGFTRAIGYLVDLSTQVPDNADYALELGQAYRGMALASDTIPEARQYHLQAEQSLTRCLELRPDDLDAYRYRAKTYDALHDLDRAISDLKQMIALDPADHGSHFLAGILSHKFAKVKGVEWNRRSIEHLREAIRLSPDNLTYRNGLAEQLLNMGRVEEALVVIDESLNIEPLQSRAHRVRSCCLRSLGDNAAALVSAMHAVELAPGDVRALQARADVYNSQGQQDPALADYNRALAIDPTWANPYIGRATILLGHEKYSEALVDFDTALALKPFEAWAYKRRAKAHLQLRHYEQALADLQKTLSLGLGLGLDFVTPQDVAQCPQASFREGWLELSQKAIESTDTDSHRAALHRARAKYFRERGEKEQADAEAKLATELETNKTLQLHEQQPDRRESADNGN